VGEKKLVKEKKNEVTKCRGKKGKGKIKQKQVQVCPCELSSESDERVIFPGGASGPSGASSSSGRPQRQPRSREISSESDINVIFPGGASGPNEASSSSSSSRPRHQLPSRFRDDSIDDNNESICIICGKN